MGYRIIKVSGELVSLALTQGTDKCLSTNVPRDAKFVRAICPSGNYTLGHDVLEIVFESEEWEGPGEGEVIPVFTPIYTQTEASRGAA